MFRQKVRIGGGLFKPDREMLQALLTYVIEGCPAPPPNLVKQASIAYYQMLTGCRLFIETGTYLGEMLTTAAAIFERCYSIELSEELYQRAKSKFANQRHVELMSGSSAELLPKILRLANEPAIIWLDAHYSGGITAGEGKDPLSQEFRSILQYKEMRHSILIDDARGLGVTQAELLEFVKGMGENYHASILHDSVRVVPKEIPLLGQPVI